MTGVAFAEVGVQRKITRARIACAIIELVAIDVALRRALRVALTRAVERAGFANTPIKFGAGRVAFRPACRAAQVAHARLTVANIKLRTCRIARTGIARTGIERIAHRVALRPAGRSAWIAGTWQARAEIKLVAKRIALGTLITRAGARIEIRTDRVACSRRTGARIESRTTRHTGVIRAGTQIKGVAHRVALRVTGRSAGVTQARRIHAGTQARIKLCARWVTLRFAICAARIA